MILIVESSTLVSMEELLLECILNY